MQRNTSSAYTAIPLGKRFQRGAQQLRAWFWAWTKTEAALYVLVGVILSLVAVHALWRPGYIAGGDFWPGGDIPGNKTLQQALGVWGDSTTGFGSPQYNPTSVFWGIFQSALLRLGLPGPSVEFLVIATPFVAEGLAVLYFVRTVFSRSPIAALASAIGLPLSLYSSLLITTSGFTFALAFTAWSAAWIWQRMQGSVPVWRFGLEMALISIAFMVLVSPPPLAIWVGLWIFVWAIIGGFRFRTWGHLVVAAPIGMVGAILINGWWLFAARLTLDGSSGAVHQAFANPFAWGWVDSHASILNLLSMQGSWSWPMTIYIPWASWFSSGLLHWALYVPAFLALIGLIWHPYHYGKAWLVASWVIVCLFIAQGLHAPSSLVTTWLYGHVPLYWVLRDPQVEVDMTLYLGIFVLSGLGVEAIIMRLHVWGPSFYRSKASLGLRRFVEYREGLLKGLHWQRSVSAGLSMVLIMVLSGSGFALWTGMVIPRQTLNGLARPVVHVPTYWFRAARFLNARTRDQKVLELPNDDFYQMPYQWGFYGVDSVAQSLISTNVLALNPNSGGYLGAAHAVNAFERQLESSLRSSSGYPLADILRSVNVGWIVERRDVVWHVPGRHILSPSTVMRSLASQPGVRRVKTFGPLVVYQITNPAAPVQAYSSVGKWFSDSPPPLISLAKDLHGAVPWVGSSSHQPWYASAYGFTSPATLTPARGQAMPVKGTAIVTPTTVGITVTWLSQEKASVKFVGPAVVSRGKRQQWLHTVVLRAQRPEGRWALQVGASTIIASPGTVRIGRPVSMGTLSLSATGVDVPVELWEGQSGNLLANSAWGPLGDCNAYNRDTMRQAGLSAQHRPNHGVELRAYSHSACVMEHTDLSGTGVRAALVTVKAKGSQVSPPEFQTLWNKRSVATVSGSPTQRWQTLSRWIPLSGTGTLSLYVYANGASSRHMAKDSYAFPSVWVLRPTAAGFLATSSLKLTTKSGMVTVHYAGSPSGNLLVDAGFSSGLWGEPFNANEYAPMTMRQAGLSVTAVKGSGAILSARSEAIGEAQRVFGIASQTLELSFEAKTLSGNPPTVVFLGNNNKTLWSDTLAAGVFGWQSVRATIRVPPSVDSGTLILYAYGGSSGLTRDQYRGIRLVKWAPGTGGLTWVGGLKPRPLPMAVSTISSNEYRMRVPLHARLLTFSESFAPGWSIFENGQRMNWKHVRVDGWLNGWLIPQNTKGSIVIEFSPEGTYRKLQFVALGSFIVILTGSLVRRRRSQSKRSR